MMLLRLLLLASLCNLSSGFVAQLKGLLTEEACNGEEYADFTKCAMLGAAADPNLSAFANFEEEGFMNRGGERQLDDHCQTEFNCPTDGSAPRGTFCFTQCGSGRRRRLSEKGTDTPKHLRRVQHDNVASFQGGVYTGNDDAKEIAQYIITCLGDSHPCLGSKNLTVVL
jgi:hypothetical protein